MAIVGAFDVHRAQLTYDYVITETGEVRRGLIRPADRARLRAWLTRFQGEKEIAFAVEACTGWRYVVDELERAGCEVHLAEPADLSRERGPKQRAKTDAADARHLFCLGQDGRPDPQEHREVLPTNFSRRTLAKHVAFEIYGFGAYFASFLLPFEQYVGGGADVVNAPWPDN